MSSPSGVRPRAWFVPALALALAIAPATPAQLVPAERLERASAQAFEQEWLMAAAVGQLGPEGRSAHGLGRFARDDARQPDGDTLFEIGSVSKVFTGLLLADAVVRGEVELDTPVSELLPDDVELGVNGRPITLMDLSTHVSGLPRMPGNLIPLDPLRPYENYGLERLFAYLDGHDPDRAPGAEWEYSNLAVGLLGQLLARQADTDYAGLLRTRILDPLGMGDTAIDLDEGLAARMAPPHDVDAEPAAMWTLGCLEAAGGIRSSVNDMLRFASFCLGELEPQGSETLTKALGLSMIPRREAYGGYSMGLGWMINVDLGIWWHNGATGGYHAMFEVLPDEGRAAVALANTAGGVVEQLADRLCVEWLGEGEYRIDLPAYAALSAEALDAFVGKYRNPAAGALIVEREGTRLYGRLSIQPRFRLWPESERRVAYRVVEAALEFHEGSPSPGAVLYQNGLELPFERLPDDTEP